MTDQRIRINVGGKVFETFESTLIQAGAGPLFNLTSQSHFKPATTSSENDNNRGTVVFFDRDPTHFRVLLNYLRNGECVLPESNVDVLELRFEALYFGLDEVLNACNRRLGIHKVDQTNRFTFSDLQFDIPSPHRTTVCTVARLNTSTASSSATNKQQPEVIVRMERTGACNVWDGNRDNAPLVWVGLPQEREQGWIATVDLRLDPGMNQQAITLFGVYEGRDRSGNMAFAFGPRTWSGTGVGYQSMHLQDYHGCHGQNAVLRDIANVWFRCRITKAPGGTYSFSYRVVADDEDDDDKNSNEEEDHALYHAVAQDKIGTVIPSDTTPRLCIGLKLGSPIPVKLDFRRLQLDLVS